MFPITIDLAQAVATLRPLVFFAIGMAVYAMFVFKFYRFLARRDIFELDLTKYERARLRVARSALNVIFYVIKFLVLFPFFAFFWFLVLVFMLAFLAKNQPADNILLVSIAVVSAIRITAYYNEDLSRDLAKILPFALLGLFIIDLSYFSFSSSVETLRQALEARETMVLYLAFVMVLESVLRAVYALKSAASSGRNDEPPQLEE